MPVSILVSLSECVLAFKVLKVKGFAVVICFVYWILCAVIRTCSGRANPDLRVESEPVVSLLREIQLAHF